MNTAARLLLAASLATAFTLGACTSEPAAPTPQVAGPQTAPAPVAPSTPSPDVTGALPSDSVYQLDRAWTDQAGTTRALKDFRGQVVVLAMIFTSCSYACPRIVADMKAIEAGALDAGLAIHFVLPSYDTRRDTPEKLRGFAADKGLVPERWTLMHGDPDGVRELSAALGGYYKMDEEGDFAHSNQVAVLDANGRVVFVQEGLGVAPEGALAAITKLAR